MTYKEYQARKKSDVLAKLQKPEIRKPAPALQPVKKEHIEYYFLHPDNSSQSRINGEFKIEYHKKIITFEIIDGILKTDNIEYKMGLEKAGLIFLHQKRVEE
jgi:hypothetical protein